MIKHYIILASAYSLGKRVALHYSNVSIKAIQDVVSYIKNVCGYAVPISTHSIQTYSISWNSVVKTDNFFKNVLLVENKEQFIEYILKDKDLNGLDVAKYILSKVCCTHLKLEKLTYLCYADYLCQEGDKLFLDNIYAYRLGPVIESVYEKFKKSGSGYLEIEDNKTIYSENEKMLPIRSRILASRDGLKKLLSIDKTLNKYANYTASDLVDLTHNDNSPWKNSGAGKKSYMVITDELIKKYHVNDCI